MLLLTASQLHGSAHMCGGNLVTWCSKKQQVVAQSSVKAEFQSLAHGIWLKCLLIELKVKIVGIIELMCDNQSVIAIEKNLIFHDPMKHVEIDCHFISDKIDNNTINLRYVPSQQQLN